jgi:Ca2+-binding RTX toxin-like protein/flagellar hook assembly protein FlgD
VKTISGHTTINGGSGNDTISVGSDNNIVDQIMALLTVNGGGGNDTLNVIDTGDANNNTGTLGATTLTGLDMPTVGEVQSVLVQAMSGSFTLTTTGYGTNAGLTDSSGLLDGKAYSIVRADDSATVTVGYGMTAADFETVLNKVYGTTDAVRVTESRDVRSGETHSVTYQVTFVDELAGIDMALLTWVDKGNLTPYPDSSAFVEIATLRQPTTAPQLDTVQTLTVSPSAIGTYTIGLRLDPKNPSTITGTVSLTAGASAEDVLKAFSAVLDPNNAFSDRPWTKNVAVTQFGNTYQIAFQGEWKNLFIKPDDINTAGLSAGTVELATRMNGINYYGIGTLNINLGQGSDIMNVQATTAVTNINTGAGSDQVYVSSDANVNPTWGTDSFLTGTAAWYTGGNTPQVQFSPADAVSITVEVRDRNSNLVRTLTLDPARLATTATGAYVATWDGKDESGNVSAPGAYLLTVTGVRADTSTFAATTFMTGTVDAIAAGLNINGGSEDNLLMVSDQGSTADKGTGTTPVLLTNSSLENLAPAPITYTASGGEYTQGITVWTGWGNDVVNVTGTRREADASANTITTLNTGLGDDHVEVTLAAGADGTFVLNTQGPYDDLTKSDKDIVEASASSLPLIIFGGQGEDSITGGSGSDIIFGDRSRVVYTDASGNIVADLGRGGLGDVTKGVYGNLSQAYSIDSDPTYILGGNDTIAAGQGNNIVIGGNGVDTISAGSGNDIIIGDNGSIRYDAGTFRLTEVKTTDTNIATGGNDTIDAGDGTNIVLGGIGSDAIKTGSGNDLILGDNGTIGYNGQGVLTITSTQVRLGGNDTILAGDGTNYVIGGAGNDTITGGAGIDYLIGDNGLFEFQKEITLQTGISSSWAEKNPTIASPTLHVMLATEPTIAGDDVIHGGGDNDIIMGGVGTDSLYGEGGDDVVIGDNGKVTWSGSHVVIEPVDIFAGGDDFVSGGSGLNILMGGWGSDGMEGNFDNDIMAGEFCYVIMDGGRVTSVTFAGNDPIIGILFAMYDAPQAHKTDTALSSGSAAPFVLPAIQAAQPSEMFGLQFAQVGTATSEADLVQQLNVSHAGSYSLPSAQPLSPPPDQGALTQPQQQPPQDVPLGPTEQPQPEQLQAPQSPQGPQAPQPPVQGSPADTGSGSQAAPEGTVPGDVSNTGATAPDASEKGVVWIDRPDSARVATAPEEIRAGADLSAVLAGFTGWGAAVNGGSLPGNGNGLLNRAGFKKLKDEEDNKRFRLFGGN